MILKVLIAVSLLQVTVNCDEQLYLEIDRYNQVMKGYILNTEDKIYSYITKEIESEYLKNFVIVRREFKFLEDLIIKQKKVNKSEYSANSTIYFLDLIKINLPMKFKISTLIKSFFEMLDGYQSTKYFKEIDITIDSFGYSSIEQKFFFIDIEKLGFTEQTVTDRKAIHKKIVFSFYKLLVDNNLPLTNDEKTLFEDSISNSSKLPPVQISNSPDKLKIINNNESLESLLQVKVENHGFAIPGNKYPNIFDLDVRDDRLRIVSRLNGSQKVFTLDNSNDLVIMVMCKRSIDHDHCKILNEYRIDEFNKYGYSCYNYRYEIEVQESSFTFLDKGKKTEQKLYEIYLIFSAASSAGIILNSLILFTEPSTFNFNEVEFFLCKDESVNLAIYKQVAKGFEYHSFKLGSNSIQVLGYSYLIQTTQSIFTEGFEECRKPETKVYFYKKLGTQIIFHVYQAKDSKQGEDARILDTISSYPLNNRTPFLMLNKCHETLAEGSIIQNLNRRSLTINNKTIKYPHDVIFRYEDEKQENSNETKKPKNVESDCYTSSSNIEYVYLNENGRLNNFYWNFNLEDNETDQESDRTIVFISKEKKIMFANVSFDTLIKPSSSIADTFISLSKDSSSLLYKVRIVKCIEGNKILEIFFSDGINSKGLTKPPESFSFKHEDAGVFSSYDTIPFGSLNAVYLSNTEIVYHYYLDLQKNCYPKLELEKNGENIRISCNLLEMSSKTQTSPSYESYKPSEEKEVINPLASPSLYRVLKQTKIVNGNPFNPVAINPAQQQIRLVV